MKGAGGGKQRRGALAVCRAFLGVLVASCGGAVDGGTPQPHEAGQGSDSGLAVSDSGSAPDAPADVSPSPPPADASAPPPPAPPYATPIAGPGSKVDSPLRHR